MFIFSIQLSEQLQNNIRGTHGSQFNTGEISSCGGLIGSV
jgi:hypothetical protein